MTEDEKGVAEEGAPTQQPHPRSEDMYVATLLGWRWMKKDGMAVLLAPNADVTGFEPIPGGDNVELAEEWDKQLPMFLTSAGAATEGLAYLKEQAPSIGRVIIKEEVMPVVGEDGEVSNTQTFWNAQIGSFENATKTTFAAAVCQAMVNALTELKNHQKAASQDPAPE